MVAYVKFDNKTIRLNDFNSLKQYFDCNYVPLRFEQNI